MTFKKVLPFILIIVILTTLFGPFVSQKAYAASESLLSWKYPMFGFINPDYFSSSDKIPQIAAVVAYYVIWMPANLFLSLGGWALDTSISLTINSSIFRDLVEEKDGAVSVGWTISRDIVNIFLIFILLYIAIATILQVSGYGAKELLATLIIIAFLVNFSMVITKMIIDASNVLAMGFYNAFPTATTADGQVSVDISQAFKQASNLENIVKQVDAIKESKSVRNLYLVQFLSYLLGAGIAAIAGFIFLVFAVLFVIRMVVLLVLIIFAPLAFAAMILPSTKDHAKKWWHTLFSQAFFAPAGLFMLYLAAKMATSMNSLFKKYLGMPDDKGITGMIIDAQNKTNWENLGKFILQFVIIAIILIFSIIFSKQMGAMGAESAISGLKKAGRKAQGYAGRIGRRVTAQAGGYAAEKVLQGEGRVARFAQRIPLVTRGLAGISGMEEKRKLEKQKKYEKAYGTYSEAGLQAMLKTPIITPTKRRAIERVLERRKEESEKRKRKNEMKKILDDPTASSLDKLKAYEILQRADLEEKVEKLEEKIEEPKGKKGTETKEKEPKTETKT